jgi:3-(3-hydroxy-phenyl)propionate hydroxylase
MSSTLYDVAIAGFGPSGAVAAAMLGQAGLNVYVFDRQHEVYDIPRAIALDHEIMRVFQQLGIAEQIEPYCAPFTDSYYYGVDGQLIRRMSMVSEPYPQGYVPSIVFTQPPVEKVLRKAVAEQTSVTVETGLTLISMEQDEQQVILSLQDENGHCRSIRARYAIGCDGASSTLRDLAGLLLQDLDFDEPWLVVDVMANESGLAKLPQTSVQYCDPQRPCTFVIGPGNHRRWEISLKEEEDPKQAATAEGTWRLLERWITPDDATLWRQASYRFHALVADQWRNGRVFIAGDAAHQQPPFLGQGMCQGIRDISNLVWKLVSVITGQVGTERVEALLDSYGIERKEHVCQLTTTIKSIGAVICERDINKARQRDAQLLAECGGVVKAMPRQNVLPRLTTGLLCDSPAAGTLFPQPWIILEDQQYRMDKLIGNGWRLIIREGINAQIKAELREKIGASLILMGSDGLVEADNLVADWFAEYGVMAALVRPDNYVYGTAIDTDALENLQQSLIQHLLQA